MGNNSSNEAAEKVGYRVLGVQANSPAARGGLVSWFGFIFGWGGGAFGDWGWGWIGVVF
jgi:hypothetical protein